MNAIDAIKMHEYKLQIKIYVSIHQSKNLMVRLLVLLRQI